MILSFLPRLLCICLALFFLIHLALGLAASLFSSTAIRWAERMRSRSGARFLLWVRAFGPAFAFFVVGCIAVDYTWFEPSEPAEEVGFVCLTAAVLGLIACAVPFQRALRTAVVARRHVKQCCRAGRETRLPGDRIPVVVIETDHPFLALTGLVRPRLVISQSVMEALSPAELGVAVRHERAHRLAKDNLKRLLLLLAPDVFPFWRAFQVLERGWARFAEWAADDRAVGGNPNRSVLLAGALVRIAREGTFAHPGALATPLLANVDELSGRVNRLLGSGCLPGFSPKMRWIAFGVLFVLAASLTTVALHPATMQSLHWLLEEFHEAAH